MRNLYVIIILANVELMFCETNFLSRKFVKNNSFYNYVCGVQNAATLGSLVECSALCTRNITCNSFHYNSASMECLPMFKVYTELDTEFCLENIGMNYYVAVDATTGTQCIYNTDCPIHKTTCLTGTCGECSPGYSLVTSSHTCQLEQCYDTKTYTLYVGHYDKTASGKTCQRWDSQTPHSHDRNNPTAFPDPTLADAANYCRDPDNEGFLWCYTTDPKSRYESCGISRCECYTSASSQGYSGTWNFTETGKQCQRWDSQTPHSHDRNNPAAFPDSTLTYASNYCRDPDNEGFPWCYTTDPDSRWESCGISRCE